MFDRQSYSLLSDNEQVMLWSALVVFPCAADDCLHSGKCIVCNGHPSLTANVSTGVWDDGTRGEERRSILSVLKELCDSEEVKASQRIRVLSMLAVRSFVLHTRDPDYLDLGASFLGELCLRSLQSSVRELRVAAGYVLRSTSV